MAKYENSLSVYNPSIKLTEHHINIIKTCHMSYVLIKEKVIKKNLKIKLNWGVAQAESRSPRIPRRIPISKIPDPDNRFSYKGHCPVACPTTKKIIFKFWKENKNK